MSYRRKKYKKRRKTIVVSVIGLLCIMTAGYAAFQTNLSISAKGNIKDIKKEVDAKVPTNDLLFWGQADNEENTLSILKDKTNHKDGVLKNFNNNSSSGFNNGELIFDGIDDYVEIGYANYDFKNSISYVMYSKLNSLDKPYNLFGAWGSAGGGLEYHASTKVLSMDIHPTIGNWYYALSKDGAELNHYYTLIGCYDGTNVRLYVDGILQQSTLVENMKNSSYNVNIGAALNNNLSTASNISLKEALLYDRALTEDEVKSITSGFEKKYK